MRPKIRRPARSEDEAPDLDSQEASAEGVARRGPMRPGGRPAPDLARKRVAPVASQAEELAALEAEESSEIPAGSDGPGNATVYGKHRESTLPMFQRNKAQDLLAAVSEGTDTDRMERRVFRLGLVSSIVLLGGSVLAIVTAMFFFRSRSKPARADDSAPWHSREQLGGAELAEKVAQAQNIAKAFFEASEVEQKRRLILDGEREAAVLGRHYALLGVKEPGQPQLGATKALQTGLTITLLVPVQYPNGDTRVAGVVEKPDGFFLDWRSAITPMALPWEDFLHEKPAEAQLFRVRLLPAEGGQVSGIPSPGSRPFRVQHGDAAPLQAAVPADSRVASELDQKVTATQGKGVWLDLYLKFDPDSAEQTISIVGSVPEKWTF
ncbi:MAG: hypothetical protein ACR2OZ_18735 [Verrucomicrobiales bacterium]